MQIDDQDRRHQQQNGPSLNHQQWVCRRSPTLSPSAATAITWQWWWPPWATRSRCHSLSPTAPLHTCTCVAHTHTHLVKTLQRDWIFFLSVPTLVNVTKLETSFGLIVVTPTTISISHVDCIADQSIFFLSALHPALL